MFSRRKVAEVLLTANGSSHVFAVVRYTDGGFGITRGGEPIHGYDWSDQDLDTCMEIFMGLAGIAIPPGDSPTWQSDQQREEQG